MSLPHSLPEFAFPGMTGISVEPVSMSGCDPTVDTNSARTFLQSPSQGSHVLPSRRNVSTLATSNAPDASFQL